MIERPDSPGAQPENDFSAQEKTWEKASAKG